MFVVAALLIGYLETVVAGTLSWWVATSSKWLRACESSRTGVIRVTTATGQYYEPPCSNLRR
jgi:hypothetical protein